MTTTDRLPTRLLPLLYLGTAHVSLALAFLFAACWPHAVAGFFYHAWLIGLVHLVTLGWISFSILGTFYIVGPLALQMEMPPRAWDYVAYGCATVGLIGMVGHFWIQQYAGMAWSAGSVASGVLYMTARIAWCVRRAKIPAAVKAHIILSCVNFWLAAAMGLLIAIDKVVHVLPGFVLSNVFAHAHLAALGWATLMVVGVGYRLLPMTFPSKIPTGRSVWASAVLLETGVLGLFATLLLRSAWAIAFGLVIVAGLAVFIAHVVWMRRHLAARPPSARRIQFGVWHAANAGASLIVACAIGVVLLVVPMSPKSLQWAAAYGVLGLIGFLAQMVIGMEARLLPMVTWFWAYEASRFQVPPPSPHVMRDQILQALVFGGWTAGVPALAVGMWAASALLVRVGAWALFVAVALATLDSALVVAPALRPSLARSRSAA
ncbi:MAG TPA: hypothetical protein VFA59_24010 [Vicinamibacterales bacterium]|nr:hypothetical protein [Vicinamibacterales bacterium]